jgi:hypothetical protein
MILDKLYIDEAKRIRRIYLNNLAAIVEKEEDIQKYFEMIEEVRREIEHSEGVNQEFFVKKLLEINDNIEKIKSFIMPHYESIQKLDDSQKLLYNNIKDKYPEITDEEIQSQIVPHIVPIDKEFTKKNVGLYNKMVEKQNNYHS